MIRTSLFAAATALCFAPIAQADHERYGNSYGQYHGAQPTVASAACERQNDNDRLAGGLVGAVAGGLIGAAIGGELEPDNGFNRYRGHRGYRGYRGHRRGFYHDRGDDGAEIAGAVIGGLLGAAVGSELAGESTNCTRTYNYGGSPNYGRSTYRPSDIGGVYAPTRSPTGPAWENPGRQQSQPVSASAPAYPSEPAYPSTPAYPTDTDYGLAGAPEEFGECTTVRRETRLPDGTIIREPVEVCQTEDGRWQMPREVPES
ncbi:MAG: hypothetical protein AAFR82_05640 [Pseudomonadota bacterium]